VPEFSPPAGPRRVLLVEDDDDCRELLATLLNHWGFSAVVAADGPAGLQRATAGGLDAVVVDLSLPGFGGLELARRVREWEAGSPGRGRLVLVALTGHVSSSDRRAAEQAGFDRFLAKPAEPRQLARLLAAG
jgi:CheY-like chemotaxis protein